MKNVYQPIFLLLSLLVLGACASSPKKPEGPPNWILSPYENFPKESHIVGIGNAESLTLAKDRARSDLAKSFQVAINETLHDNQMATIDFSGGQANSTELNEISRELISSTQQTLRGITIAESWFDNKSKQYYVLATLNKTQTMNALHQQISSLDEATGTLLNQRKTASTLFDRIQNLQKAIALQTKREGLQHQLRVVDMSGLGITPQWPLQQLKATYTKLAQKLTFHVVSSGEFESRLNASIKSALRESGYQVEPTGKLRLNAILEHEPLTPKGGWFWGRGFLNLQLVDTKSAQVVNEESWRFKVSATDKALLKSRISEKAHSIIANELNSKLLMNQ